MTTMPDLIGQSLGEMSHSYTENDVMLYALAVGAHAAETQYVYERDLVVLPTFPLTIGLWAVRAAGATGAYDATQTLHAGQSLSIHGALPVRGTLQMQASIDAVWDKGSAAVVDIRVEAAQFTAVYTIFVPNAGGFGGERGARSTSTTPDCAPTCETTVATSPDQAALYRLTGDPHPVHIDPEAAAALGFERPILHGLCTLGATVLAISRSYRASTSAVRELSARFSSPVLPGDDLRISAWGEREITYSVGLASGAQAMSGTLSLSA